MTDDFITLLVPAPWMSQGACAGLPAELFFPHRGQMQQVRAAKRVCAECLVKTECGQYALDSGERHGVWGGLSEKERRHLRAAARKQAS